MMKDSDIINRNNEEADNAYSVEDESVTAEFQD